MDGRLTEGEMCVLCEGDDDNEDGGMSLGDVFELIKRRSSSYECIEQVQNSIVITITKNNNNKENPTNNKNLLQKSIQLLPIPITLQQTLNYTKLLFQTRQQSYKSQILKLKSNIYQLMTQLQDASELIRSQSHINRHHKEEIKWLKKQMEQYRTERVIKVENSSNRNIMMACRRQQIGVQSCMIIQTQTQSKTINKLIKKSSTINNSNYSLQKLNRHYQNNYIVIMKNDENKCKNKPISGLLIERQYGDNQYVHGSNRSNKSMAAKMTSTNKSINEQIQKTLISLNLNQMI